MAESIFDLIYGTDRFKKPQTGLMSSFDDTDYGDLTAQPEKDYLQGMKTRDKIALLTSPYPVVGGITGTYADAMNMYENPEERNLLNAGLMATNWIPSGRAGREVVEKTKDMLFDPRYAKTKSGERVNEQEKLKNLETETTANTQINPDDISIFELEGKPIISTMADRAEGGKVLTDVKGVELNEPVVLRGGQNYMMNKENIKHGNVWASDIGANTQALKKFDELKRATGENALILPYTMKPTGIDFSHQTTEVMLSYADTVLDRSTKSQLSKDIKKIVPKWKGFNSPEKADIIKKLTGNQRKELQQLMHRDYSDQGLSLPEARIAVSDINQLNTPELRAMNVGQISGRVGYSNHPSYPQSLKGEPVGRIKEDVGILDLFSDTELQSKMSPDRVFNRRNPTQDDYRAFTMSPRSGILTEDKLRKLEGLLQ